MAACEGGTLCPVYARLRDDALKYRENIPVLLLVSPFPAQVAAAANNPHLWGELDDLFSTVRSDAEGTAAASLWHPNPELKELAKLSVASIQKAAAAAKAPVSILQLLLDLDVRIESFVVLSYFRCCCVDCGAEESPG